VDYHGSVEESSPLGGKGKVSLTFNGIPIASKAKSQESARAFTEGSAPGSHPQHRAIECIVLGSDSEDEPEVEVQYQDAFLTL